MQKHPGFVPFYWDDKAGKIFFEINKLEQEFLFVNSLPFGVGSNDLGLDRGKLGDSRIVYFHRVGPKVLLIQPNYQFRALTTDRAEKQAVQESFAQSVLWGFKVVAEEGGKLIIEGTDFVLSDVAGIANHLKKSKEGSYKLDSSRSAIYLPRTKNFPRNTEIEVTMTFTGQAEGKFLQTVVPSPEAVTVHLRHSFIALPERGYRPREFHPQSGFFEVQFTDFAAPLGQPLQRGYVLRHRLQKKNPGEKVSEPIRPIIYYVDRGAPEPIRSALLEGARWWSSAFEAAGFKNAFRVEIMPEDADPMDVRFNTIQWVHRSTRGWSYGNTIFDPRSGEIICGRVTLGSLRVRQDMLIAEGLLAPFENGKKVSDEAMQMAMARLRQLSAHEVGHTLGLAHNFAASLHGNGSVMDYPHPHIEMKGGKVNLGKAYGVGIGPWDKVAIAYGYSEFAKAEEHQGLLAILARASKQGLEFITDADARPAGGAHPRAHLWDNGKEPTTELRRLAEIRFKVLQEFGERNIPEGMPQALLEERLVPIYLLHRYQVEAVSKILGGVEYSYAVRGEEDSKAIPVSAQKQKNALSALMITLEPKFLAIPLELVRRIPPRPPGFGRNRELFPRKTGVSFDPLTAAGSAAEMTIALLLNPQRCNRLVEQKALDKDQPGLSEVIDIVLSKSWIEPSGNGYMDEISRIVDGIKLHRLMGLSLAKESSGQVKALARWRIQKLASQLESRLAKLATDKQGNESTLAHFAHSLLLIRQFEEHPDRFVLPSGPEVPPGMPIGGCSCSNDNFPWNALPRR